MKNFSKTSEISSAKTSDIPAFPQVTHVHGSFHQGHQQFAPYQGKQCGPNSVVAVMSTMRNVLTWRTKDLDEILCHGNVLYGGLCDAGKIASGFVAIHELPIEHKLCNTSVSIDYGQSFAGVDGPEFDDSLHDVVLPLEEALQRVLLEFDACLLTIHGTTCAIVRQTGWYALCDSHARNAEGPCDGNGKSVLVYRADFVALYRAVI